MKTYRISIDDHHCRPIRTHDWRDALGIALDRVFPGCWSPSAYANVTNGHAYIDVYKSGRGTSHLLRSHVEVTIKESQE